ncbi:MAG: uroporphyrinogen-III synthase [Proteobacteria bacterium]|nr:uroporphyrinogen-III synthase [Pseudomonadota bacterium]MBS0573294.1 uroporphyrinogen-III synthase [Pseudomonadota bacterium]
MRPTLLLTRPRPQSERFAGQFRATLGGDWPVVISPLMRTVWLDEPPACEGAGDIIFTSETGVAAFCRLSDRRDLLAWCVGGRTAKAAERAGFAARCGPGDATGLAATIRAERPGARMLWAHGRHVAKDMAILLESAGIETISCTLYEQMPLAPSAGMTGLLEGDAPVLLPLFSARSADLVARLPTRCPLFTALLAPSITPPPATRLSLVAARPDSAALIETLRRLAECAATG